MKVKPKAETGLVRAILDALEIHAGVLEVWRWQSGMVAVKRGWMHLAPKGTPDIGGYLRADGRMVAIETKTLTGGELDPDQVAWRDRFVPSGGLYIGPCRTVAEALAGLGLGGGP